MAIKIIDGKAVVVKDESVTEENAKPKIVIENGRAVVKGSAPVETTQQTQNNGLFTQKDPGIVLNTLKDFALGILPGSKYATELMTKPTDWKKETWLSRFAQLPVEVVKDVGGIAKGIAGLPFRVGLSGSDLLGGPKKLDVPILGPQQSYQEGYRQLKQEGAGPLVSAAIPTSQAIMDLLIAKSGKKMLTKPKEVVEPKIFSEEATPGKPAVVEKPAVIDMEAQKILDNLVKPTVKKKSVVTKTLEKFNPYKFESAEVEATGPAGKEIVTRGRRAWAQSLMTTSEFKKVNKETGISKFTPEELVNFRDVMEGKAQPVNPVVAEKAQIWRGLMDKYAADTGVDIRQNYYPRRLNEAGRKFYEMPENREQLITKIMDEQGVDRKTALGVLKKGTRKGTFEFERMLQDVDPKYRLDPLEELYKWEGEVARRVGIIQEFGKNNEVAKSLLENVGKGDKNEGVMKDKAQTYLDRLSGKIYNQSEFDPIYNFLKSSMVVSKINPITTISNELQGHINSFLDYGVQGLADSTFGKAGKKLVSELGLDNLKGKIGDELSADSFATKWMKAVGMEGSEIRGFARTAQSTYSAIERAFESLKKNPMDKRAYKLLKEHGMFIDDTELANSLRDGIIPDIEMKLGIVEGVRKKMFMQAPGERPTWANTGAGSTAYIFHNYILNQMKLLAKAPPERQLAYMMVIAPLTGFPVYILRRLVQGKEIPTDPKELYMGAMTSGPGTPFDVFQSLNINPAGFALGGFSPILDILKAKGVKGKVKETIRNFVPMGSTAINRLFPPQTK